jgi:hypothetical protein
MSGYLFNGVNVANLIINGSTTVPGYTSFPKSSPCQYTSTGLDKPYNFSYMYNGTDVSNYATAYGFTYNGGNTGNSGSIPTTIPNTNTSFKHISGYCWGGGGGGGGGGSNTNSYGGGDGGNGGDGAFAAIIDYPISGQSVNYSAGNNGGGGSAGTGKAGDTSANAGSPGKGGGSSYVYVGNTQIILANGGSGGSGGEIGQFSNKGSAADDGKSGTSSYISGYTGTTSNSSPSTSYPNNPGNGSNNGLGGNGVYDDSNSGSDGASSYVAVYLSYQ